MRACLSAHRRMAFCRPHLFFARRDVLRVTEPPHQRMAVGSIHGRRAIGLSPGKKKGRTSKRDSDAVSLFSSNDG